MKKILLIIAGVLGVLILAFFIFNRIYRLKTIDKNLGKKIENGAVILDVRTEKERKSGYIEGSKHISLGTIRERYVELDTALTYITYCSHGIRSVEVKNILKEKGIKKVYNGGAISDLQAIIDKINQKRAN